jgi:hypothetical protein
LKRRSRALAQTAARERELAATDKAGRDVKWGAEVDGRPDDGLAGGPIGEAAMIVSRAIAVRSAPAAIVLRGRRIAWMVAGGCGGDREAGVGVDRDDR